MDEPKRSGAGWLIVAGLTLLVLIGGGWALLSGMPFHKDQPRHETAPPLDTIAESSSPGSAETQIGEPAQATPVPARPRPAPAAPVATVIGGTVPGTVPRSVPPPSPPVTARVPSPAPSPAPASATIPAATPRTPSSRPATAQDAPPPTPTASSIAGGLMSESDAVIHLRSFLAQNDPYGVPLACLDVHSLGLRNRGYTLEVAQHPCDASSDSRTLGRWRVDALTREIFRQRGDGRFLRP